MSPGTRPDGAFDAFVGDMPILARQATASARHVAAPAVAYERCRHPGVTTMRSPHVTAGDA
jgi:hypothetical protein